MSADLELLEKSLTAAVADLPKVTSKKMFGCPAFWADGNVFALVWKQGRIGFKLPVLADYDSLIQTAGAGPWKAGPMQMSHWVLVPESFHGKASELRRWAAKAYEQCIKLEKNPKKAGAKPKAKAASAKPTSKKPSAKSAKKAKGKSK